MAPSPTESAFHNRQLRQWRLQVSPAVSAAAGSPGSFGSSRHLAVSAAAGTWQFQWSRLRQSHQPRQPRQPRQSRTHRQSRQSRQHRQHRQSRQPRRLLARPRLPDSILRQPAESASRKGKGIRQICNLPPYRPHHEIHLRAPSPFHLRQTPLHGAGETFSLTPAPPVPPLRILLHIRRAGEFHEVTEIFTNCL